MRVHPAPTPPPSAPCQAAPPAGGARQPHPTGRLPPLALPPPPQLSPGGQDSAKVSAGASAFMVNRGQRGRGPAPCAAAAPEPWKRASSVGRPRRHQDRGGGLHRRRPGDGAARAWARPPAWAAAACSTRRGSENSVISDGAVRARVVAAAVGVAAAAAAAAGNARALSARPGHRPSHRPACGAAPVPPAGEYYRSSPTTSAPVGPPCRAPGSTNDLPMPGQMPPPPPPPAAAQSGRGRPAGDIPLYDQQQLRGHGTRGGPTAGCGRRAGGGGGGAAHRRPRRWAPVPRRPPPTPTVPGRCRGAAQHRVAVLPPRG